MRKNRFVLRLIICFISVCLIGASISWLKFVHLGTDPCSLMNFAISEKIGLSFGTWQAIFNIGLLIIVTFFDRSRLGTGTFLNMFLVGYSCDLMTSFRKHLWPDLSVDVLWIRILIMVIAIAVFVITVGLYLATDLGSAPYDSVPIILDKKIKKLSFSWARILYDLTVTLIGVIIGGSYGSECGIVTALMVFTVGPVVSLVKRKVQKYFV